jgi:hypothetical protein
MFGFREFSFPENRIKSLSGAKSFCHLEKTTFTRSVERALIGNVGWRLKLIVFCPIAPALLTCCSILAMLLMSVADCSALKEKSTSPSICRDLSTNDAIGYRSLVGKPCP